MATASFAIASAARKPTVAARSTQAQAPAKSLARRILDRLIAARAAQAQVELARHSHMAKFSPESVSLLNLYPRN